jgi:hypothetical protein
VFESIKERGSIVVVLFNAESEILFPKLSLSKGMPPFKVFD